MNKEMLEIQRKRIKEKINGCERAILRRERDASELSDEKEVLEFLLSIIEEKIKEGER
jgi:hypothetical protein